MKIDELSINSGLKNNELGVQGRDGSTGQGRSSRDSGLVAESVSVSLSASSAAGGYSVFAKTTFASVQLSTEYYEKFYSQKTPSPNDVANVIVGAVKGRLEQERASGADDERLRDLLVQANEGVEKGYKQARDDIQSLGLMTEQLDGEISDSYGLVKSGLNDLEEAIDSDDGFKNTVTQLNEVDQGGIKQKGLDELNADDVVRSNLGGVQGAGLSGRYEERYAESQGYELQLMTRDGDRVNITLNRAYAEGINVSTEGAEYASSSDLNFQINVIGELDEEERAAIDDLLSQAGEVAELFYSDRYLEAFNAALSLGFDSSEIASFSLDLTQSTYQEVRSYENLDSKSAARLGDRQFQPLVDMVNALDGLKRSESVFEKILTNMNEFVNELLDGVNAIRKEEGRSIQNETLDSMKEFSADLMLLLPTKDLEGGE